VDHRHVVVHVSSHGGKTTIENRLGGYLNGFGKFMGQNIWFYSLGGKVVDPR
jgi:hypothetical protein